MSDDFNLEDTLKNIFFAGVGAVSLSAEKSKKVIDKLVEKGEITVEQGKAMNKELKHKAEEAAGEAKKKVEEAKQEAEEKVKAEKEAAEAQAEEKNEEAADEKNDPDVKFNELLDFLGKLNDEQRAALKEKLNGPSGQKPEE